MKSTILSRARTQVISNQYGKWSALVSVPDRNIKRDKVKVCVDVPVVNESDLPWFNLETVIMEALALHTTYGGHIEKKAVQALRMMFKNIERAISEYKITDLSKKTVAQCNAKVKSL